VPAALPASSPAPGAPAHRGGGMRPTAEGE
jgi:hypothetical protein